jgi:hypothetical protein
MARWNKNRTAWLESIIKQNKHKSFDKYLFFIYRVVKEATNNFFCTDYFRVKYVPEQAEALSK